MTPELGMIEGFFGRPWSWQERQEAVRFLAPYGYGFFLYAPKADALLRRRWQDPYPPAELERLATLSAFCRSLGVRFGVGLSPFELHLALDTGWQGALAEKIRRLASVGLDDLAILFDDMRGDMPGIAERQAAIVDFAADKAGAGRVICCPSYYSDDPILDSAFGERPPLYLEELGRRLDPAVEIMWTGPEVCSREISVGHIRRVAERVGRKPFLWDNYPVNDGPRMAEHLHLRAFTGRPAALGDAVSAHGINLASQPVLSRIPALTLVESYSRGEAYDYAAAFARVSDAVLGADLASQVRRDLLSLQDRGRDRLGNRRAVLRERYQSFNHPAAQEIVAWLDGAWSVTDEEVQTQ